MSKRRNKQFNSITIFFKTLITTFSIFITIVVIFGCVKITQNVDETIEVGTSFQCATIKWLFFDVSNKAKVTSNNVDTTHVGDYKVSCLALEF